MVGILTEEDRKGRRPQLEEVRIWDMRFLSASVPAPPGLAEKKRLRRLERGAELLWRAGARRVLTAPAFAEGELLRAHGLRPVDPVPFCQALAAPLALAALERAGEVPTRAAVALSAPRASRPLLRAAEFLCPRVRYLMVDMPGEEGDRLAAWLREEYGAAVLRPGGTPAPAVVLCFGPGWRGGGTALHLYGPVPDLAGLRLAPREGGLPQELDELPLLALLWEEGRIKEGEIGILPV